MFEVMIIVSVGTDVRSHFNKLETTHCSVIMTHLYVPGPLAVECAFYELIISDLACVPFMRSSNTICSVSDTRCFNNGHKLISR